jgi:hypothetical protein
MHDIVPPPNLNEWITIKDRGALIRSGGKVYRSQDGSRYLRTGSHESLRPEIEFLKEADRRGFPVPKLIQEGSLPDGLHYFIERSAGSTPFAFLLRDHHTEHGEIKDELFQELTAVVLQFLQAQLHPDNHQTGSRNLYKPIQVDNIRAENPELPAGLIEAALDKASERTGHLPLVITHGDFNPFNIMPQGIIDFELRFTGPAGYDAITCITFHRIWDHPKPDGTGTMKMWEFSPEQIQHYLNQVDDICRTHKIPPISPHFDDFLMLKAVWALSYEHPAGREPSQVHRWNWRKKVALHVIERYMKGLPLQSEDFYRIGLGQA